MAKTTRARYTLEFKEEAVRLVTGSQQVAAVAKALDISFQTLHNWVKVSGSGRSTGATSPKISAEQMEISHLKSELARVKMERDILKKRRRALQRSRCEVRLYPATSRAAAGCHPMLCPRR